ncbi:hypothetical protein KIF59_04845 [Enterobacter cloacae subsp. cloacae]|nr:hypothetical protein [Enterobacter cloacae subsp. cloacae]
MSTNSMVVGRMRCGHDFRELVQTRVGIGNNAGVRSDGTETEVQAA